MLFFLFRCSIVRIDAGFSKIVYEMRIKYRKLK
uniref:Uncharacterized protein n=1 Tax=Rhizophora mucronata TaxID=61149 RepID=A0A2P2QYH2_RHIMU